jgi:hypothetical protein
VPRPPQNRASDLHRTRIAESGCGLIETTAAVETAGSVDSVIERNQVYEWLADDSARSNRPQVLSVLDVHGDIVAGTAGAGTVIEAVFGLDEDHFQVATVTAESDGVSSAAVGALGFDLYPGLHSFVGTTQGDGGTQILWQAPVDVDPLADLEILIEGAELHPATSRSLTTKVASA